MKRAESGSAMILLLMTSILVVAFQVQFLAVVQRGNHQAVHQVGAKRALDLAESGVHYTMDWLRRPSVIASLTPGIPTMIPGSAGSTDGRVELTVTPDPYDASLVAVQSKGVYYSPAGPFWDGSRKAHISIVEATLRVRSISDFFAAVATSLQVDAGVDLSSAAIYARDLIFARGSDPAIVTRVGSAYYFNTVSPNNTPVHVQVTREPYQIQHRETEPNLVHLDDPLRGMYQSLAGADVLDSTGTLYGDLGPPANPAGVYYREGNLKLGAANLPLRVSAPVLLYVRGKVEIDHDVLSQGDGWLVVLAEGGVTLTEDAPLHHTVQATLVTNGSVAAELVNRSGGSLSFTGGVHALAGISIGQAWPQKTYVYQAAPPDLPLPFFVSLERFKIQKGRYHG